MTRLLVTYDLNGGEDAKARRDSIRDYLVENGGEKRGESAYELGTTSGLYDALARLMRDTDEVWVFEIGN